MGRAVLGDRGVKVDAGTRHADEPVPKALPDVVRADGLLRRPLKNCPDLRLEPAVAAGPRALPEPREVPIEPESRGDPRDPGRPVARTDASKGDQDAGHGWLPPRPLPMPGAAAPLAQPFEPTREHTAESALSCIDTEIAKRGASATLLAGTALVPLGRRK
jgi:hypothetical protein